MDVPLLPSDFLIKLLAYLQAASEKSRDARLRLLASDLHDRPRFRADVNTFVRDVLLAMGTLPGTEERTKLPLREVNQRFFGVKRAFDQVKQLLHIAVDTAHLRKEGIAFSQYMAYYFDEKPEYRIYKALAAWLWRRSRAGAQKLKEYSARPEVKKRIAKNRPSKEEEAERQRTRYWRKKGFTTPPPRLPREPLGPPLNDVLHDEERPDVLQ